MKTGIHPTYHQDATITCTCGNVIKVGSTKESYSTELCSKCHPFYTGKKKTVDTAGRIEKFEAARKLAEKKQQTTKEKAPKKRKSVEEKINAELQKEREREDREEAKLQEKLQKKRESYRGVNAEEPETPTEETAVADEAPEEVTEEAAVAEEAPAEVPTEEAVEEAPADETPIKEEPPAEEAEKAA